MSVLKLNLTDQVVEVEYRKEHDLYFVVYPELKSPVSSHRGYELVMPFRERLTAGEIATNTTLGVPFFDVIPVVTYGSAYPRQGLSYPKVRKVLIPLRML